MKKRQLGKSELKVSEICMGTMTFGTSCDEKLAFEIMDRALEAGINFFDTAEIYPIPCVAETVGNTETIVGNWLKTQDRDSIILATKIVGPSYGWFDSPVRHGRARINEEQIIEAVEGSLKRLQTDYIDLYQVHWPDHSIDYQEPLSAFDKLIRAGKIRVIGSSNETSWGAMNSLRVSENNNLPRFESIQNNFSLINRRCESELAQVCRKENMSLLPYSPLGGGVLTGKYNNGHPEGARFTDYLKLTEERRLKMATRFVNDRTIETTKRLMKVAESINTSVTTLSVAWSKQHDFVASTIIGATSVEQLNESLIAADLILDDETLARIDQIDFEIPTAMTEDGLRRL